MQLFIDTANIDQIRTAWSWGIIDGVTTNPTHIAATGRDFEEVLAEIFQIADGRSASKASVWTPRASSAKAGASRRCTRTPL